MRCSIILASALMCFTPLEAPAKIGLSSPSIEPELNLAVVKITADSAEEFLAALLDLQTLTNWNVEYGGKQLTLVDITIVSTTATARIRVKPGQITERSAQEIPKAKPVTIQYVPAGAPLSAKVGEDASKPTTGGPFSGCYDFGFTDDKDKAAINISGGFQAGVDAKPQYFWSAKAECNLFGRAYKGLGSVALSFAGEATEQKNADPDSLKAGIKWNRRKPSLKGLDSWRFDADLLSYEFERKINPEAVLKNGKPTLGKFLEKNSNLMWAGQARYVTGLRPVNFVIGVAGFEAGRSITRTVKADARDTSGQPIARLKLDADMYYYWYKNGRTLPLATFHAQHTARVPFYQEPYSRAGENGGEMYLTSKARHWTVLEIGVPIAYGSALSIQYKRGSLPPSFEFVNHQVTLGFNLLLGNN